MPLSNFTAIKNSNIIVKIHILGTGINVIQ